MLDPPQSLNWLLPRFARRLLDGLRRADSVYGRERNDYVWRAAFFFCFPELTKVLMHNQMTNLNFNILPGHLQKATTTEQRWHKGMKQKRQISVTKPQQGKQRTPTESESLPIS
jgi:hypothetical protein